MENGNDYNYQKTTNDQRRHEEKRKKKLADKKLKSA